MAPGMAEFWDERARENPLFFVDDQLDYADPNPDAFWAGGVAALDGVLEMLDAPALRAEDVVVEIGCGIGRITRPLAQRCSRIYALDVSERMLALAREHNPDADNVHWLLGDGESLTGVPDRVADACYSFVVFQHIPDPAVTLGYVREMGRVLRPGGWSAFHISNDPGVHQPRRRSLRARLGRSAAAPQRSVQRQPEWLGSSLELESLCGVAESAGLEVERVVGAGTQFCLVLLRRG